MTRANKAMVVLIVASLGLWGCSQAPGNRPINGQAEQIKALESRIAKVEEDYRAAAATRDQVRRQLATAEEQHNRLLKERDVLQKQVVTRTTERDNVQNQYEQFRKNIRELLGQADAAAGSASPPVISAADTPGAGKS